MTTKSVTGGGAPLAEMMFYEAAEQAVEDGYARIVPDAEVKISADEGVAGKAEQAGQDADASQDKP